MNPNNVVEVKRMLQEGEDLKIQSAQVCMFDCIYTSVDFSMVIMTTFSYSYSYSMYSL